MHSFMTRAFAALVVVAPSVAAAQANEIPVIPRPVSVKSSKGVFRLTARTVIVTDRADSAVAQRLAFALAPATGFALPVRLGTTSTLNRIVFRRAASRDTSFGDEGYRLDVKPGVVTITSAKPAGAFYATQSLRQLLPPEIDCVVGAYEVAHEKAGIPRKWRRDYAMHQEAVHTTRLEPLTLGLEAPAAVEWRKGTDVGRDSLIASFDQRVHQAACPPER